MKEKQQKVEENVLGTEKIGVLLARFAIPGIAALVINALYNIVDQIFIGRGVGYLGNAATNVIFPLTTFAMALALMIGDGTASFMSLMLGKREDRKAAQGTVAGMIFTVVSGLVIAILYLLFLRPLCSLFGATEKVMPYALQYGTIISIGIPFCAVCAGYASIIRADGSPKYNMVGLLAGCILNLIGDPIFIFVFDMGVSGAAWATIIGQIANAIINFLYIPRLKSVRLKKEDVKQSLSLVPSVLKLGLSSFISQMVLVIVMAVQNNILRTTGAQSVYGADMPIAALGVTMKVFNILMVIVIGLASGAQPIWGYNYGARKFDRVQKAFNRVIIISTCVMIFAFILFQLFPMSIVSIFGSESDVYNQFAIKTLRIFLLLVPVSGFQLAAGIFFQAVGRPVQASLISLSKQIIFMIPAMIILSNIVGVEGVLWAGPVSDALSFILTVLLLTFSWKSIFGTKDSGNIMEENHKTLSLSPDKGRYTISGKPLVITIERSYGAGGREIGKAVSEKFSVPYYDTDILKEAAEESGLSAMFLAFVDEKALPGAAPTVAMRTGAGISSEGFTEVQKAAAEAQFAVIEKVSSNGSCVIVGRRADKVLSGKCPVLKVFITMPLENRIQAVMNRENLGAAEAEKLIKHIDKERAKNYNIADLPSWSSAEGYDLCLDVSKTGKDGAVDLICSMARKIADK